MASSDDNKVKNRLYNEMKSESTLLAATGDDDKEIKNQRSDRLSNLKGIVYFYFSYYY